MKTDNLNQPGEFSHAKVRGHIGRRAGTPGPTLHDAGGNEVTSSDITILGAGVAGDTEMAYITIRGTGDQRTNDAGAALEYGDVVVLASDGTVTTTTTPQDTRPVGVVQVGGGDGQPVIVVFSGFVARVNCTASVTAGTYGETSSTAGKATSNATIRSGSFCQFLDTSATPSAYLFAATATSSPGASGGLEQQPTAIVQRTSDWSTNSTDNIPVEFDTEVKDTDGFYDGGDPERLTVPAAFDGFTAMLHGEAIWPAGTDYKEIKFLRNGDVDDPVAVMQIPGAASGNTGIALASRPIPVEAGDYFQMVLKSGSSDTAYAHPGIDGDYSLIFSITVLAAAPGGAASDAVDVIFDSTGLDNTDASDLQEAIEDLDAAITAGGGGSGNLAGTELDYVAFTSAVAVTATSEGSADTVVTSGSVAYNGSTVVLIEFFSPGLEPVATTNAALILQLYEDSTLLGYIASARTPAGAQFRAPCHAQVRRTPSNASHTYTVKAWTSTAGTAYVDAGAGGTGDYVAGFIRITRVSS